MAGFVFEIYHRKVEGIPLLKLGIEGRAVTTEERLFLLKKGLTAESQDDKGIALQIFEG